MTSQTMTSHLKKTMDRLTKAHPLISVAKIGTSRLGNIIYALTLGHGERTVLINATHHANEWITTLIALKFLEECAQNPQSWIDNITLHVVPLVNPDGADAAMNGYPNWKANIIGVDLNSNYPAGWEMAKKYKFEKGYTKPGPRDYVGEYPLSEPETTAMVAYTIANDFSLTVSLHTQGEEIYWQYQDYMPPGAEDLAQRMSAVSGYPLVDVPESSAHGGYRDWFIEKFNRPGITIECGLGESPLPLSDFDDIYNKVSPMLLETLKATLS